MLGSELRKIRKSKKKTLRDVERETGISNAHLSQVETGKIKKPSQELLEKLSDCYNVDVERFLVIAGYEADGGLLEQGGDVGRMRQPGIQNLKKFVTATDLNTAAERRKMEGDLPRIIRRLILATCAVNRLEMPSGDSVNFSGWDGRVEYQGEIPHPFVPEGMSFWEMSKRADISTKANSDFKKRTDNPLNEDITKSTFIFVTPRRWPGKNNWVKEKIESSTWKDIRVYDADDLEWWLETSPVVGLWLAKELQLFPEFDALPLCMFWEEWLSSTSPSLNADFLLLAKPGPQKAISDFLLREEGNRYEISVEEKEIGIAYLRSVIGKMSAQDQIRLLSRGIVVHSLSAFRQLYNPGHPLLLIPVFEEGNALIGQAMKNGHKVFIPSDEGLGNNDSSIKRIAINEIANYLQSKVGYTERKAKRIAGETRGSLSVLRQIIANRSEVPPPSWTNRELATQLIPLALAGSWDSSNESDREVIELLAGKPYEEFEALIHSLCDVGDSPCRRIGKIYTCRSQGFVYGYLREYITPTIMKRLEEAVLKVLGEVNPKYELSQKNWFAARIFDKKRLYSENLRKGLSAVLALIASQPPMKLSNADRQVEVIIFSLFNDKDSWEFWASLYEVLPTLAEAAPEHFLDRMEVLADPESGTFLKIFSEEVNKDGCEYASVLWALEGCAWKPEYLGRVCSILARFSSCEYRENNQLNQPTNSLLSIMRLWKPQTMAGLEQRFRVIDVLLEKHPEQAWELLLDLIPSNGGGVAFDNHFPEFRDWADGLGPVSTKEVYDGIKLVCDRFPGLLEERPERWLDLIGEIIDIPFRDVRLSLFERIKNLNPTTIGKELRLAIWEELEKEYTRQKKYGSTAKSFNEEAMKTLEEAYKLFTPSDPLEKWRRAFNHRFEHPECISQDYNWREEGQLLDQLRQKATKEIYEKHKMQGLLNLSEQVDMPYLLGHYIAKILEPEIDKCQFISDFDIGKEEKGDEFLRSFIRQAYFDNGYKWAESYLKKIRDKDDDRNAFFLLALPFESKTWDLVEMQGDKIKEQYWKQVSADSRLVGREKFEFVIQKFLKYERPLAAFHFLCYGRHFNGIESFSSELVLEVLEALLTSNLEHRDWRVVESGFGYDIKSIFDDLRTMPDVDKRKLGMLEFNLMSLFPFGSIPENVYDLLDNEPELFAELITYRFKSDKSLEDDLKKDKEISKVIADRSFELMFNYRGLPGLREDGSIDDKHLENWVFKVREICNETGHKAIADIQIGEILARSPVDDIDEKWPHRAVRNILEKVDSSKMEDGFRVGIMNSRGVVERKLFEGGKQELDLAEQYSQWAEYCEGRWIRTTKVLREVERDYRSQVVSEDDRSEIRRHMEE